MVKVEGKTVPLRDLAQVSIKDAKTLMVNINDVEVIEAINSASQWLSVYNLTFHASGSFHLKAVRLD